MTTGRRPHPFRPTIGDKLYILNELETSPQRSLKSIARQFRIQPVQIWNWQKQCNVLLIARKSNKGLNPGRPSRLKHLEDRLLDWIHRQRSLDLPLSYMQVVVKASQFDENFNLLSDEQKYSCVRRLCKMNRIVIRVRTHLAQQRPDEVTEVAYNWLFYIRPIVNNNVERRFIINMDKTPCPFSLHPNRTLAVQNSRTVTIRRSGNSTVRASAVLTVASDGSKLKPMLVFKGVPDGRIATRELPHYPSSANVELFCQRQAWMDDDLMQHWINRILVPHLQQRNPGSEVIVILDRYSAHRSMRTRETLERLGIQLQILPAGSTSHVQPCNVGINKPFKDRLRKKWWDFMLQQGTEASVFVNPCREDVTSWVDESWADIPEQIVRNSWNQRGYEYFVND